MPDLPFPSLPTIGDIVRRSTDIGPAELGSFGIGILESLYGRIFIHLLQQEDVIVQNIVNHSPSSDKSAGNTKDRQSLSATMQPRRVRISAVLLPPLGKTNQGRPLDVWLALMAAADIQENRLSYVSPSYKTRFRNMLVENLETSVPLKHGNAIKINLTLVEYLHSTGGGRAPLREPSSWERDAKLHKLIPRISELVQRAIPGLTIPDALSLHVGLSVSALLSPDRPEEQSGKLAKLLSTPRGTTPRDEIPQLLSLTVSALQERVRARELYNPMLSARVSSLEVPALPDAPIRSDLVALAGKAAQVAEQQLLRPTIGQIVSEPLHGNSSLMQLLSEPVPGVAFANEVALEFSDNKQLPVKWQRWQQQVSSEMMEFEAAWNSKGKFPEMSVSWRVGDQIIPLVTDRKMMFNQNLLEPVKWHPLVDNMALSLTPISERADWMQAKVVIQGMVSRESQRRLQIMKEHIRTGAGLPGVISPFKPKAAEEPQIQ